MPGGLKFDAAHLRVPRPSHCGAVFCRHPGLHTHTDFAFCRRVLDGVIEKNEHSLRIASGSPAMAASPGTLITNRSRETSASICISCVTLVSTSARSLPAGDDCLCRISQTFTRQPARAKTGENDESAGDGLT